jgi:phenylalanyl-tRNA synthetase beta chain
LDIEGTVPAVQRACELIELLGAGEVVSGMVDEFGDVSAKGVTLDLEPQKINAHLGTDISTEFMLKTLKELGFGVDGEKVTVPSWRSDIEHWTDLSEEVARFYGYDVIAESPLSGWSGVRGLNDKQRFRAKIGELARAVGFSEILTYSMTPQGGLRIINPLGEDKSRMRVSLLPSMLEVLARNRDYGNMDVKLYEVALVYLDKGGKELPDERELLVTGAYGDTLSFFEFKGMIEELLTALRIADWRWVQTERDGYHPKICAELTVGVNIIGIIGQIHPKTADKTFAAELDVAKLMEVRLGDPQYKPLPRFPAVLRDLSVIVDSCVTIDALLDTAKAAGGKLLEKAEFFDLYTGTNLPAGKKSVAFSLIFRDTERSLTDEEVNPIIEGVVKAIAEKLGAELRK